MPDILVEALALDGLGLLIFAAILSGVVRGFSGFGTAMIFLPFAAQVVSPFWAVLVLVGMDIFGPLPLVPKMSRQANKRELGWLVGCAALGVPIGVSLLFIIPAEVFRYIMCGISFGLVLFLVLGLRYRGEMTTKLVAGAGAAGGISAGLAGLPGPPVILLYMASTRAVAQVRANLFLFLIGADILLVCVYALAGEFHWTPLVLGIALAVPNSLGNLVGQYVFNPDKAGTYRAVAYVVVAVSAIMGLPLWD